MGRKLGTVAVTGVVLAIALVILVGCGESESGTVGPTVASSVSTTPPETSSPIAASGLPKLVEMGSLSCTPCKLMAVELEALTREYAGSVDVVVVDVYEDEALARELGIRVLPTQIFYDPEGNELLRHEGYLSREDIVSRFQKLGYPLAKADASSGQETGGSDGVE